MMLGSFYAIRFREKSDSNKNVNSSNTAKNSNDNLDNLIEQAEKAIGKQITSEKKIQQCLLVATPMTEAINDIDEHLKNYFEKEKQSPIRAKLLFLKAQLLHKIGNVSNSIKNYEQVIELLNGHENPDTTIIAQTHIALANIMNQKEQAVEETKKVTKNDYPTYTDEFKSHLQTAIELSSENPQKISELMQKYYWPCKKQKKIADEMVKNSAPKRCAIM